MGGVKIFFLSLPIQYQPVREIHSTLNNDMCLPKIWLQSVLTLVIEH